MAAFLKLGDIKGESTSKDHKDWIIIDSMSAPIFRSIAEGAKDTERTKGATTTGDISVVRSLDKSSVKIQEGCAIGNFYKEAEIELCTQAKGKQEPYLKYKLHNVIISSYSFHGNSSGDPLPTEEVTLSYTKVEWTYILIDPKTGDKAGNVAGGYDPGEGT